MHFMSIEVAAQSFLFPPPRPGLGLNDFDDFVKAIESDKAPTGVPFSHNHLHDLESLWWVAVWVVFHNNFFGGKSSGDHPSITLQDAESQVQLARTLFPPVLKSTDRLVGFQSSESFKKACDGLPRSKKAICARLNGLREFLTNQYKVIEAGYPLSVDPSASNDEIYEIFTRVFSTSKTDSHGLELDYIPGIFAKLSKEENMKRTRSKSTTDGGVARKNPRI